MKASIHDMNSPIQNLKALLALTLEYAEYPLDEVYPEHLIPTLTLALKEVVGIESTFYELANADLGSACRQRPPYDAINARLNRPQRLSPKHTENPMKPPKALDLEEPVRNLISLLNLVNNYLISPLPGSAVDSEKISNETGPAMLFALEALDSIEATAYTLIEADRKRLELGAKAA